MNIEFLFIMRLNGPYLTLDTLHLMTLRYCISCLYLAFLWFIALMVIVMINQLKKLECRSGFTVLSHGYFH